MNDPEQEKVKTINELKDRIAELEEKIKEVLSEKEKKEKELDEINEDNIALEKQLKNDEKNIQYWIYENRNVKSKLYLS